MKNLLSMTAALALTAGAAFAETTTQAAVLGESGNAGYPLQVRGGNGVLYNCMSEIQTVDGVRARQCIRADGGGLLDSGAGLGAGVAAGAGALLIVAIASSGGSSTTTSTN